MITEKYGKVVNATFSRISPTPTWGWNNWLHNIPLSGGAALDLHIHDVDFMRFLMGEPDGLHSNAVRNEKGIIMPMPLIWKNLIQNIGID